MNTQSYAKYIGMFVLGLGVLGLLMGEHKIGGVMNVEMGLDLIRIALGGLLIYTGFSSKDPARTGLMVFGVAYLGAFLVSLVDPSMFGLLPLGVGAVDHLLHLGGGIVALALAMRMPAIINAKTT